jgi:pimeloyl-ACP methyl ester carboxylesterase
MKGKKRKVVVIASLLVAGFVMFNVIAYSQAYAMTHFASVSSRTGAPETVRGWKKVKTLLFGVRIARPVALCEAVELDPACRALLIDGVDGTRLAGWYCDRGADTTLVILFHGYAREKTDLLDEAKALLSLGASVLLVDFRGSGGSSESYTTIGVREARDVMASVQYAKRAFAHRRTILFGQSMGAVAILKAIDDKAVQPDGVILEAVFDTMLNTVQNRFRAMRVPSFPSAEFLVFWGGCQFGFNGFRNNPVDYARSLQCPALFMHGTDDARATLVEGRRVYEAAPGVKTLKAFEKTGHESYVVLHEAVWKESVAAFLGQLD